MSERTESEGWVEAILSGEKSRNDPLVAHWLQEHPEQALEITSLIELAAQLDSAGAEQRETLSQSRESQSAAGDEHVTSVLKELIGAKTSSHTSSKPRFANLYRFPLRLAVAVAVVAAASLAWNFYRTSDQRTPTRTPIFLGESAFDVQLQTDEASQSRKLTWTYELSPGGSYSLSIWNTIAPRGTPAEFSLNRYTGQECVLPQNFGPTIRVQIMASDAGGEIENSWIGEVR
ncbi:MAG: hypothetical protein ACI8TQ_001658 [Planctomycetota bacterium]|jgi:hypothetical protein